MQSAFGGSAFGSICRHKIRRFKAYHFPNKHSFCITFMSNIRLSARWSYPPPPLGNFADIPYLKEQSFLHIIRDVCTLQVGA